MKNFIPLLTLFSFVVVFAAMPAQAKTGVGDPLPHNLMTLNQDGANANFETIVGEKGLVLVFVRSLDWCPYCKSQVVELSKHQKEIEDLGYNIASISYDKPETLKSFAEKFDVELILLSDEGSDVIKAFGILNEEFDADHFAYGVPHPHIYIISKDANVLEVLAEEGYKERPSIKSILESLGPQ